MASYITYLRVSTGKQGDSGLGIEAQREYVTRFLQPEDILVREAQEVESGRKNNRPVLLQAIEECQKNGYILLIAKLDRLTRNAGFFHYLEDSGVNFICADMPQATPFTLHIYAALAQQEARLISERTRAALAAKKRRGEPLGTPANLDTVARARAVESIKNGAATAPQNVQATHLIKLLREKGDTLQTIASTLNGLGYKTRRGCAFTPCAVQRLA